MSVDKLANLESRRAALIDTVKQARGGSVTPLYTYLNRTLKSPRLRKILRDGAQAHEVEDGVARRA